MALRLVADKIDDLPEALRKGAVEKDGRWLAELGDHSVENATALKEGLVGERGARKKLEGMLRSFGWTLSEDGTRWVSEGVDPTQARDALDKIRAGSLKGSEEYDRWKASIQDKYEQDKRANSGAMDKLKEQLRRSLVLDPIRNAIRDHGGSFELLAPVIERAARVEFSEDGSASVALVNEKGQPMLTRKSGSTDPMGFDEYVQELRKHPTYRQAFAGVGAGGSGFASQSGGSARVVQRGGDVTQMSPRELIERGNQYTTTRSA